MSRVWVNGSLQVDAALASSGVERGLGVFETMRSRSRIVLHLSAHLERLRSSARLLGIQCPPQEQLLAWVQQAVMASQGEGVLRVQLGSGLCLIRSAPLDCGRLARPLSLMTATPSALELQIATAKHCSRAAWEHGARQAQVDELLWVDKGHALETHQGNVFAQVGDTLVTPPLDGRILAGTTRAALIVCAHAAAIPLQVRALGVEEIQALWVSSALKELAPVHHLNKRPLNEGTLGPALLRAYRAHVQRELCVT